MNGRSDTIKNTSDTINGTINQRREVVNGSNEPVNEPLNEPLNESDSPPSLLDGTIKQRLFSVIIQTEGLKRESLASRLSVSLRTVARLLAELENVGKIIYSGSKKTGGYYAVK